MTGCLKLQQLFLVLKPMAAGIALFSKASRPSCKRWSPAKSEVTEKPCESNHKNLYLESGAGITQIASQQPLDTEQWKHAMLETRREGQVPCGKSSCPEPGSSKCKDLSENRGWVGTTCVAVSCHRARDWKITMLHYELPKTCRRWSSSNVKCDFGSWLWWWRTFPLNADCASMKASAAAHYILLNSIIKLP